MLDFDLLIFDGNQQIAQSMSWDNSYEIVEFSGEPGETYKSRFTRLLVVNQVTLVSLGIA